MVVPKRKLPGIFGRRQMYIGIKTSVIVFLLIFSIGALTIRWIHISNISGLFQTKTTLFKSSKTSPNSLKNCSIKCPAIPPPKHSPETTPSNRACPQYFRWIHEDLKPWKITGITREITERAENVANIRIIIINGRIFVKKYKKVFQTRDVITVWGLLQLLRLYPGRLPDLDLMFECNDRPVVRKRDYSHGGAKGPMIPPPPPVFHYCGDDSSFDIVFPDWSFWGWPELNIKAWEKVKEEIEERKEKVKWKDREAYAYWKGNARLGAARQDLVKCNISHHHHNDWNARIYNVEWKNERKQGFKASDNTEQCTHRYKIYVEGIAWSVSQKYIMACDSMTLLVAPRYYDFFTRGLVPMIHYWPINQTEKCSSIKFAVDWGNKNAEKAQRIGKAGSRFIQEELSMKFIYDYMFHLLLEYGKLLKYRPTIPDDAVEVCSENMLCNAKGIRKKFILESMIKSPANSSACIMPPPFIDKTLQAFLERKEILTKKSEIMRKFSGKDGDSR